MKQRYTGDLAGIVEVGKAIGELGGRPVKATLEYSSGGTEKVRLAVSLRGNLMRMNKRSRRHGSRLDYHDLAAIILSIPDQKTPAQEYADNLRKYRNYFNKNALPNLWQNIRASLKVVTDTLLDGFAAIDCASYFEAWELAGKMGLPQIEHHKTITLKSCEAPQWIMDAVREAVNAGAEFTYSWRGRYDYRVAGKKCEDDIYKAWLSQEYKGCGNGHYWLLISAERAIFCEDD